MTALERLIAYRRPATFAAAALAGIAALWTGAGTGADETLRAARHGFRLHPASGEVHIVEIDERSIDALQHWPWPRGIHAAAVDRLRAAGARLIAFDVDFSSPSIAAEDARFAAALARAGGSVILPTFGQERGSGRGGWIEKAPIPPLAQQSFLAAANVLPDDDGSLRRMPYGLNILGAPRPSLASMVAERPADAGESFAIDTDIDPATIPRHSMIDLIAGRIPVGALRGKRIIVGATAVETADRYALPRHGLMPGVVAQAMAAETLIEGPPPIERSGAWPFLLALFAIAAAVRPGTVPRRASLLAGGAGAILALPFAESLLGAFPLGGALAALGTAGLIGGGLFLHARFRERSLADPATGLPNLAALERDAQSLRTGVAVARIESYPALAAALGAEAAAALVVRLAGRVAFAAGTTTVYRTDESSLAWLEPEDEGLSERLEGVAAVMHTGVGAGTGADVRLHFGAATGSAGDLRQLVANAGLAALQAAGSGARARLFTVQASEEVARNVALLSEFGSAVADGRIWNAYQPKLDLATGRVKGVEALVRWDHQARGPLAPDAFVPLLEQQGRAAELTLHVLGCALEEAARWARNGEPLEVAVNVSATLLHDHGAMLRLQEAVRASGVAPELLTIEVTETAAMADPDRAIATLESWRALGAGVSIDDYGTGQSSLSYLQKLPATELKIDKSFVASIADQPRNAIMVRSTIAMAHELGLRVVAEGVEDEACLALLKEMGCDLAQGYLIARPMAADQVAAFAAGHPREGSARRSAA